ncbi:MAG: flagellar hook-length control protein FliK [Thiohalospira sp.]
MGSAESGSGGKGLPDGEHPFAGADKKKLQALFGVDGKTAEEMMALSGEEARELLAKLQEMLAQLQKQLAGAMGEGEVGKLSIKELLGKEFSDTEIAALGGMDDAELAAGLGKLGGDGDADSSELAAGLLGRFLGIGGEDGAGLESLKGEGGEMMGLDLTALMQRLENGGVGSETRQAIEGAVRRADDGSGGRQWQQALLAGLQAARGESAESITERGLDAGRGFNLKSVNVEVATNNGSSSANFQGSEASARALMQAMGGGAQSGQSGLGGGMGQGTGGLGSQLASAAASASSPLTTPVNSSGWGEAMSERVLFMANNHVQRADVRLHPQNMGPLEIRVQIQNDQASVNFNVHNAGTREAVEQALPRLREMLEAQGIDLADVDVSGEQREFARNMDEEAGFGEGDSGGSDGNHAAADGEGAEEELTSLAEVEPNGLVDTYA